VSLRLETLALSLLCQSSSPQLRTELISLLRSHPFLSPDHQAILTALLSLPPSSSPADIRLHLPAALTRLGFPDTDTTPFFSPLSQSQIDEVIRYFRQDAAQNSKPR